MLCAVIKIRYSPYPYISPPNYRLQRLSQARSKTAYVHEQEQWATSAPNAPDSNVTRNNYYPDVGKLASPCGTNRVPSHVAQKIDGHSPSHMVAESNLIPLGTTNEPSQQRPSQNTQQKDEWFVWWIGFGIDFERDGQLVLHDYHRAGWLKGHFLTRCPSICLPTISQNNIQHQIHSFVHNSSMFTNIPIHENYVNRRMET